MVTQVEKYECEKFPVWTKTGMAHTYMASTGNRLASIDDCGGICAVRKTPITIFSRVSIIGDIMKGFWGVVYIHHA
jgi:hypothetical protein